VPSADGTNIAFALSGEGPPLVRTGTWLTHIQHDWDSPVWRHWFRLLSERNTLVRYDLRGCGLSQREGTSISIDGWVDDLAAVVDHLGLERFPLLGMSQGAGVSILYALRYPERVSQLVLYAPAVTGWRGRSGKLAQRWRSMEELVRAGWGEDNLAFPSMFAQLFIPGASPEHIRLYADLQRRSADKEVATAIMAALGEVSVFNRLEELDVPTVVYQVAGDQAVSAEGAAGVAARIKGAEFVSLESDNHILMEDDVGWQQFCGHFRRLFPAVQGDGEGATAEFSDSDFPELSRRERDVFARLARGESNREIAEGLFISEKTVSNHLTSIFAKLGVSSRSQAIVRAKSLLS